jgi:ABC-2 type transport system permease protein
MMTSTAATAGLPSGLSVPRWRVTAAIVRRDYLITRSYKLPFVLDAFYGLLELAVYFFISRTFHGFVPGRLQGAPSYFAFAAAGIAVAVVVGGAASGLARRLREEQLTGTLEALVVQPLTSAEICLGLAGFPLLFAIARAAVYLAVAGVWMDLDLSQLSWPGLILLLVVTGTSLSVLGILSAAIVLVLKRGEILAGMLIAAMTVLSGSVFPISALPDWLEPLGRILPLRFAFDGVRAALFRGEGWGSDFVVLLSFSVVGLAVAIAVFDRALDFSKKAASLGQY